MHNINEVTIDHIKRLDEKQLNSLLNRLLNLEASANLLPNPKIEVPENEKSKDGGIDGSITWTPGPSSTPRLPSSNIGFQNKATELSPDKYKEELLVPKEKNVTKRKLKPEVEALLKTKGNYIAFTSHALNPSLKKSRINKMREALKEAGFKAHASAKLDIYDANSIKDWVNQYSSAVNLVQGFSGVSRVIPFRDWTELNPDIKADAIPYEKDETIESHISKLHEIENVSAIRVIGHSGIGKTRLIAEAFRPSDTLTTLLNSQFVYIDLAVEGTYKQLYDYIISQRNAQSGIIIADNCDAEKHSILAELVNSQGSFKLITVGFDDSKAITDPKIRLDRQDQKNLVRAIVQEQLGSTHLPQDIDFVSRLCEGYPWMAVRYCEVIKESGMTNFDLFFEEKAIRKLVFGAKKEDEKAYGVLRACAVFSAFGFVDDSFASVINENYKNSLQAQSEFIRNEVCDDLVSESKFREILFSFKGDDIIEQRGTYYIVKPTVLAIQLAAEWLKVTPIDKIKSIIENLKTVKLEPKFVERLSDLDQLDKARAIVEELWGMNSSFGSAEVLNTKWGSLLFRYVVEVNPEATVQTLVSAFEGWSKKDLLLFGDGRRNIIWALEKLCFRRSTFLEAGRFLFQLAISENETWANNATGQIRQLFQRFLAGTEATYEDRIELLDWALEKNDTDYTALAISCMGRALMPRGSHHRTLGAEDQGSGRPLVDFMPATWDEIFYYWREIIDRLIDIINNGDENNSEKALVVLAHGIRPLISEGGRDQIFVALKIIGKRSGQGWLEIRSELKKALRYEKKSLEPYLEEINEILEEFQPKTLQEQFVANVTLPEWTHEPPVARNGQNIYKQQIEAEEFANRLINDRTDWSEQLPSLLIGEQRQTFSFGKIVGEIDPNASEYLDKALVALKKIDRKSQNPGLIMGLVTGINDPTVFVNLMERLLVDPNLYWLSFHLTRHYDYPIETLMRLFDMSERFSEPIASFDYFRYGSPMQYLSQEEIEKFINKIASYGAEGVATAFSILFMQCFQNNANWVRFREKLREFLLSTNLLLAKLPSFESFYWGETAIKLLKDQEDKELAIMLSEQIAEFSNHLNFSYRYDHDVSLVLEILIEQYFNVSWPAISKALGSDYISVMHLKSMIGAKNGSDARTGVLFSFPENYDQIYDWAKNNERGRLFLANILPFSQSVEIEDEETGDKKREIIIHPFAMEFLNRFGNDEKVLDELVANLGTFSTVGGSESYYKTLIELTGKLINHPLPKLKAWAKKAVKYYEKSLKVEILENQNRDLD